MSLDSERNSDFFQKYGEVADQGQFPDDSDSCINRPNETDLGRPQMTSNEADLPRSADGVGGNRLYFLNLIDQPTDEVGFVEDGDLFYPKQSLPLSELGDDHNHQEKKVNEQRYSFIFKDGVVEVGVSFFMVERPPLSSVQLKINITFKPDLKNNEFLHSQNISLALDWHNTSLIPIIKKSVQEILDLLKLIQDSKDSEAKTTQDRTLPITANQLIQEILNLFHIAKDQTQSKDIS